jgi:hypothetical protein
VPNHTLFVERIYNLTETAGAVHEFLIAFNMFGRDNTNMVSYGMRAGEGVHTCVTTLRCPVSSAGQDQLVLPAAETLHAAGKQGVEGMFVLCTFRLQYVMVSATPY